MASDTSVVFTIIGRDRASVAFNKIGAAAKVAFAVAATASIAFGKSAIDSASNLAETQSKVHQIFGSSAASVLAFSKTADKSLGQSQQQALDAASTFAVFGKGAGLAGQDLVGFSTRLTTLAGDMASFSNTTPQDAIEAIGAALRGENDPIEKYGVLLNDATLRNEALRLGLIKTTKNALTPQQRVLAAQAAIFKQTQLAQGDFARTSGGLANQQRILAARLENVKASLGQKLLPVTLKVATAFGTLMDWFDRNQKIVVPLVVAVGALAGVVWAVHAAAKAYTAVQIALNIAMSANPIGLVIVAIIALVAATVYLWNRSAAFRNFFIGVWGHILSFVKGVGHWFSQSLPYFFVSAWNWIKNTVISFDLWLIGKFLGIVHFFTSLPGRIRAAARGMWDGIVDAFKHAINWVIGLWNNFHLTLGGGSVLGIQIPSITLSTPDIPYLAQGGVVTGPTLAVLGERGPEAVIPLDRAARGGNTYNINIAIGQVGNSREVGAQVVSAIQAYERANGTRWRA